MLKVTAPIGRDTITATMVKEDGLWKLEKIDDMQTEFGVDAYAEANDSDEKSAEQSEQIDRVGDSLEKAKTQYSSFDEALAAAKSIDPNSINPFTLPMSSGDGAA